MRKLAVKQGSYVWPPTGQTFPKIQILSVEEILKGIRPDMPPVQLQGALFGAPKELVPSAAAGEEIRKPKQRKAAERPKAKPAAAAAKPRKSRKSIERPVAKPAAPEPEAPAAESAAQSA